MCFAGLSHDVPKEVEFFCPTNNEHEIRNMGGVIEGRMITIYRPEEIIKVWYNGVTSRGKTRVTYAQTVPRVREYGWKIDFK